MHLLYAFDQIDFNRVQSAASRGREISWLIWLLMVSLKIFLIGCFRCFTASLLGKLKLVVCLVIRLLRDHVDGLLVAY